jgi:hypothetical protein
VDKKTEEKDKTKYWLNEGLKLLYERANSYEAEAEEKGPQKKKGKKGKQSASTRFYNM